MNEVSKSYWAEHNPSGFTDTEPLEKEVNLYNQISLTKEGGNLYKPCKKTPACMMPVMWGHYGDKGKGVCIRINISEVNFSDKIFRESVFYKEKIDPVTYNNSDITQFIAENKKDIFFTKTKVWEYEKEYKIVSKEDKFLDISNAVSEIIITNLFRSDEDNCDEDNCGLRGTLYSKVLRPIIEDNIKILEFCSNGMNGASLVDEEGNQIFPQKTCNGEIVFSEHDNKNQ
jgi:hypothetical protein